MRLSFPLLLGLFIALNTPTLRGDETVTVGGAVVPVAKGWTQTTKDGTVVLAPPDLPQGVACTFTLLGGETFDGSLEDRLNAEWKEFQQLGRMTADDGGKINGAGTAVAIAGRSGFLEMKQGVNLNVWLLIVSTNGRIERMVFITSTPELFTQYGPAVTGMINGTKYVVPKAGEPAKVASKDAGTFGQMRYKVPSGWSEKRSDREVVLSPNDAPRGESLEIVIMPAKEFTGTLSDALKVAWDEAAEQSHFTTTRSANGVYNAQEKRTCFKGWEYDRADGIMHNAADEHDYVVNLTVIKINDRLERILVRSRRNTLNLRLYSLYEASAYRRAVSEFIFGVQFSDWKDTKVEPGTVKGDGVIGVWAGITMFAGKLHTAYAIFFSNGQVFFASRFPLRGCHELNTWIDAEEVPRYWGTYEFKDGIGSLKMIFGEIPVVANGNDLVFTTNKTDHKFIRVPAVDGAKIDGNYAFAEWNGKIPSIRFTRDGRFEDGGALELLNLESSYPFLPTSPPGGGKYAIKDYTLLLEYDDGRKHRIAFPGGGRYDKKNASPDSLPIGYADQEMTKR
ncbi:MAG: hypothetical protein JWO87_3218 [Phycisphaerales bacterium]|nr:hypothetical protein [Phycisphaerales bacterium]